MLPVPVAHYSQYLIFLFFVCVCFYSLLVPARISSFGVRILKPWHSSVILTCYTFGIPAPRSQWLKGEYPIQANRNNALKENGELELSNLLKSDVHNYTCSAQNKLGSDSITYQLVVQGQFT